MHVLCKKCNKHFRRQRDYNRHVEDNHDGLRFECDECERGFRTPHELDDHLENDHSAADPLDEQGDVEERASEKVEETLSTSTEIEDHPLPHRMRQSYRCKPCGIDFKDEQELREHKAECPRSHWFECEFCDKTFLKESRLNKHALMKHRLTPNWRVNKHEVFVSKWAEEIRVMERRKMGGTMIFNHHKPPSADKFLCELGERAIEDDRVFDVPCAWGTLKGIFDTSQPTHDGAAVVNLFQDGEFAPRLYSTSNKLPMTAPNGELHRVAKLKGRGTRHYAGYYASLCADALIVVVSEESAVKGLPATTTFLRGKIEVGVSSKRLKELLRLKYFEGK